MTNQSENGYENNKMKIRRFFAIIVALCLFLTGCSKSFDWDINVEKIENLGFVIFNSSTNEDDLIEITIQLMLI